MRESFAHAQNLRGRSKRIRNPEKMRHREGDRCERRAAKSSGSVRATRDAMATLDMPSTDEVPEVVRAAGTHRARTLDVRGILSKGGDPFRLIVDTTRGLAADEALHLVVGFDPKPLRLVMKTFGRSAHTEKRDDAVHVWFYRQGGGSAAAAKEERPGDERVPLREPIHLDVRGLEPPNPMIKILETLAELGPGAQLVVRHHRDPVLLYEKLAVRGYAARTTQQPDGEFIVHVAPAWAFEDKG